MRRRSIGQILSICPETVRIEDIEVLSATALRLAACDCSYRRHFLEVRFNRRVDARNPHEWLNHRHRLWWANTYVYN